MGTRGIHTLHCQNTESRHKITAKARAKLRLPTIWEEWTKRGKQVNGKNRTTPLIH